MDFYHALNRGVDGRVIFNDQRDYQRFVHALGAFNDSKVAYNTEKLFGGAVLRDSRVGRPRSERDPIVDVHGWCLMKNHYHLLLSERQEGGLVLFLRKLNVGYAQYYNLRHERKGTLFQSRTKKVPIVRDAHFLHILNYIHLNPLDYLSGAAEWRLRHVKSSSGAMQHLDVYPWSSFHDYAGEPRFPDVTTTSFFSKSFGDYRTALAEYLRHLESHEVARISLE
jgi:putative transposase